MVNTMSRLAGKQGAAPATQKKVLNRTYTSVQKLHEMHKETIDYIKSLVQDAMGAEVSTIVAIKDKIIAMLLDKNLAYKRRAHSKQIGGAPKES